MDHQILIWLHLSAIFLLILSLGGAAFHVMNGGTKEFALRKRIGMLSGMGLLIILITGVLMANQLYQSEKWQHWIYLKIVLWLYLGVSATLLYRKPKKAHLIFWSIFIATSLAAYLAIVKPVF